ncbi:MAG: GTP cyclohydrolase I FolE2 [Planctomycetes bacterium]|nr:GTP cyclohydrolase I FolE2 [Planctomycetota bacterium]
MSPQDLLRSLAEVGSLPDVAAQAGPQSGPLDRVGMSGVEVPVRLRDDAGALVLVPAKADAYVSLDDPNVRGIHMSRLFLSLQAILGEEELSPVVIRRLLQAFVGSHVGVSRSAEVVLSFEQPVRRPALVSANSAWRAYPVTVGGQLVDGRCRLRLGVRIAYSSTCPCSAALARQLIQDKFQSDFAGRRTLTSEEVTAWLGLEQSILATPHSQRSYADVQIECAEGDDAPGAIELIDRIEAALGTPVQAAVKREDEQEFARLNGSNPMFCEDAARRMRKALEADSRIADYRIRAAHVESLHPHDAVSIVVKGVPGGLRP